MPQKNVIYLPVKFVKSGGGKDGEVVLKKKADSVVIMGCEEDLVARVQRV